MSLGMMVIECYIIKENGKCDETYNGEIFDLDNELESSKDLLEYFFKFYNKSDLMNDFKTKEATLKSLVTTI